jgi:hypothetical protein
MVCTEFQLGAQLELRYGPNAVSGRISSRLKQNDWLLYYPKLPQFPLPISLSLGSRHRMQCGHTGISTSYQHLN